MWKYPEIYQKVKEEVNFLVQDLKDIDIETLTKMEYITVFLKETLRRAGPAGSLFPKIAIVDDTVNGIKIKKGTEVNVSINLYSNWDKYFTDPQEFIPERWFGNSKYRKETEKNGSICVPTFFCGTQQLYWTAFGYDGNENFNCYDCEEL